LPPRRLHLLLAAALLTLIWGTTWATVKISLEGFPPLTGLALRFILGGLLLLALARFQGVELGRGRYERRLWLVQGALGFGVSYVVVYWAQQWVPSGLTSVLFSTMPLFVVLFAAWLSPGEAAGGWGLAGVLVGFGGIGLVFSDDLGSFGDSRVALAAGVLLLSPAAAALAQVLIKRWGRGLHPLAIIAVPMFGAGLGIGCAALVLEAGRPLDPSLGSVLAVVYLGVMGSALAFGLYFWLLAHVSLLQISLIVYLTPLLAVAIGTLLLDEPLTPRLVLGVLLVIAGAALVMRD